MKIIGLQFRFINTNVITVYFYQHLKTDINYMFEHKNKNCKSLTMNTYIFSFIKTALT